MKGGRERGREAWREGGSGGRAGRGAMGDMSERGYRYQKTYSKLDIKSSPPIVFISAAELCD